MSAMRRLLPWFAVWALAGALAAVTTAESLRRYREFRSGWAWDLAYNNQWFWALVFGDRTLSICPVNHWGNEGPSIWNRTHLDPIRLPCAPIYALFPGPETLLVIHNAIVWCLVPAVFGLVRSESGSARRALLAAALVPLTPLLWPLAWNDYREMTLALPFIAWAIQGYRDRRPGLAALGIGGMLLCREEYGILVATLALLPPRPGEDIGTTYRWMRAATALGVGWFLLGFLGYQYFFVSRYAPEQYVGHFGGPKPGLVPTAGVALELLAFGLGPWALLAALAPRFALLALPWVVGLVRGRWSLDSMDTVRWSQVRYTTPIVGLVVAAGAIGFARLAGRAARARGGRWLVAALWAATAAGLWAARAEVVARLERVPRPIARDEAEEVWRWIGRVAPGDGVIAHYEMTAPLSSRRHLYSYVMDHNRPRGYPRLGPEIRWIFYFDNDLDPAKLVAQGFEPAHRGRAVRIYRRP